MRGLEAPDDQERNRKGQQAAEDGEEHAIRGQRGPFVVIGGQFGGEGEVGHVHEGGAGIKEDVGRRVIGRQRHLVLQGRTPPEGHEGQREREPAKQQEGPASAPAAAGAVGDVPDDWVIDPIPTLAYQDGRRGQTSGDAHDVRQENGQVGANDGGGETEPQIPGSVQEFRPAAQSLCHGPLLRCGLDGSIGWRSLKVNAGLGASQRWRTGVT